MNTSHRIIAIALSGALLLSGFAFGRWAGWSNSAAAEKTNQPVASSTQPGSYGEANETSSAYLSDYQTGYREGCQAGLAGQETTLATARTKAAYGERAGYSEG